MNNENVINFIVDATGVADHGQSIELNDMPMPSCSEEMKIPTIISLHDDDEAMAETPE